MRTTFDPYHKDLGSFASSVCPGHHNPYRVASRVVRLWGNRENAADIHAACLLALPCASSPHVVVAGISLEEISRSSVAEMADEVVHPVLERTCPHLVQCRNRLEVVGRAKQTLCGRDQGVLDGGEMPVCRRRVSRSRVSEVSQTCQ